VKILIGASGKMTSFMNTMYETLRLHKPSHHKHSRKGSANVSLTATTMRERVRAARFNLKGAQKAPAAGN
jgi:hypothetical protein